MPNAALTYCLIYGLYCCSWSGMTAVYPLFLLSRGLDLFEINLVFGIYLITAFVFEVPTGALADVLGRKLSFLLSCLVRAFAFGLYWFAQSFTDCVVAEFFDALGTTLATGALDAWAVDSMKEEGDDGSAANVFARAGLFASPMMMSGALLGGYLGDRDIALPFVQGTVSFLLTGVAGFVLMREQRGGSARRTLSLRNWMDKTRQGMATVRRQPVLMVLCLLTAGNAFAAMPAWHYWPARLKEVSGAGTWLLGWVAVLAHLAGMLGNWSMPRLVRRFRREYVMCFGSLLSAVMLGVASAGSLFLPSLLAILAMQAAHGFREPTLQGWMNERLASEERATVLSVRAMSFTLGGGVGLICLGLIGRASGIAAVWASAAGFLLLVTPAFLLLGAQRLQPPATEALHEPGV